MCLPGSRYALTIMSVGISLYGLWDCLATSSWYRRISSVTQLLSVVSLTDMPYAAITARSLFWWAVRSSDGIVNSSYRSARLLFGYFASNNDHDIILAIEAQWISDSFIDIPRMLLNHTNILWLPRIWYVEWRNIRLIGQRCWKAAKIVWANG